MKQTTEIRITPDELIKIIERKHGVEIIEMKCSKNGIRAVIK